MVLVLDETGVSSMVTWLHNQAVFAMIGATLLNYDWCDPASPRI